MVRKPYHPGDKVKKLRKTVSEYGKQLNEKQKLRNWYNLRERPFKKYIKLVMGSRGKVADAESLLIGLLEKRLDNVAYRLGFAPSRVSARQMISHRHFMVNGRSMNIPSHSVKTGDLITLKPASAKKKIFTNIVATLKKQKPPAWLQLNAEKMEGKVVGEPSLLEANPPSEISYILEFYSR